jgi:septal ring factor EnvC (AmiA/AmiB activator)
MENSSSAKNWIFGIVIAGLLGLCGYLYTAKNKAEQANQSTGAKLAETSAEKDQVQTDYNLALGRLDELTTKNASLDAAINAKDGEIAQLKNKISDILSNKNATAADLKTAKELIAKLNTKAVSLEKQIAQLKETNTNLATEKEKLALEKQDVQNQNAEITKQKEQLTEQKVALEKKVEIAKVLRASNITLMPIKQQLLTGKEAQTAKAGRAKLIRINFDLDDNRISESGEKEVYIVVYAPNGDAYNNGTFALNNGTKKAYTTTKTIPYVQGQSSKNISLDWKPIDTDFEKGEYLLEIYHSGYKIGSNSVVLK